MLNFEDNIGLLVLKTILSKRAPVFECIFQFLLLGMELWDKTFNFEDNIGLLVLKMIV